VTGGHDHCELMTGGFRLQAEGCGCRSNIGRLTYPSG